MAHGPDVRIALRAKSFDDRPLFGALDLSIAGGEVVALLGPSGVGKTTLLRLIAGLDRDFDGSVAVGGQPAHEAGVPGYVFQDARLLPWLTASENLQAVAPDITATQIGALFQDVGLAGSEAVFPHQLSGGMQRRLGLARALCVNPKLLLLDEPFVSLDRNTVRDLQCMFLQVFEAHRPTVIIVSHDAEDAARLADRALLLAQRPVRVVDDMPLQGPAAKREAIDVAHLAEDIRNRQDAGSSVTDG